MRQILQLDYRGCLSKRKYSEEAPGGGKLPEGWERHPRSISPCGPGFEQRRILALFKMRALRRRCSALVIFAGLGVSARAQTTPALQQLNSYLNGIGIAQADARAQKVAAIRTRAEADRRQAEVRSTILKLIGGLPEGNRPVRVRPFGTVAGDGFRIENIAHESLPGF